MSINAFNFPFNTPFGSGFSFVPPGVGGTPLSLLAPTPGTRHSDGIDRVIDPATLDYVRTDNGEYLETADRRTTVLIALSIELGASPFDPDQGTGFRRRIRTGVGLSPSFLQAETERVLGNLVRDGLIADVFVSVRDQDGNVLRDNEGRLAVRPQWRDLSSGSPAITTIVPR